MRVKKPHPGKFLKALIAEARTNKNQLAVAAFMPRSRVGEICNGKRNITAETSIFIGRALGIEDDALLRKQNEYDLERVRIKEQRRLKLILPVLNRNQLT